MGLFAVFISVAAPASIPLRGAPKAISRPSCTLLLARLPFASGVLSAVKFPSVLAVWIAGMFPAAVMPFRAALVSVIRAAIGAAFATSAVSYVLRAPLVAASNTSGNRNVPILSNASLEGVFHASIIPDGPVAAVSTEGDVSKAKAAAGLAVVVLLPRPASAP